MKKFLPFFIIGIISLVITTSWVFVYRNKNNTAQDEKQKNARVSINGVTLIAEVAGSPDTRARGLSGRDEISEGRAMLFVFDKPDYYAIWMRQMRFSIDIIWVRDGKVVSTISNVSPPAKNVRDLELPVYTPEAPAEYIIETYAGFVGKNNIAKGVTVSIEIKGIEVGGGVLK